MKKVKYYTAFALICSLSVTNVSFASNYVINAPVKQILYWAAEKNNERVIQKYINLGYSIDSLDGEGMSALCTAKEKGNDDAYDLLIKYGANDKHSCMEKAKKLSNARVRAKLTKYGLATAVTVAGTGIALYLSNGGDDETGGGSGSEGGILEENIPGSNGTIENPEQWLNRPEPVIDTLSDNMIINYTVDDFNKNSEFDGRDCSHSSSCPRIETNLINVPLKNDIINSQNVKYTSVNYLGAINAAEAFSKFYGTDSESNMATSLRGTSMVGVIDTGVWGNHSEFKSSTGSKVTGYNFDYGPCLNGDNSNCWKASGERTCFIGTCEQNVVLLGENGEETIQSTLSCTASSMINECQPYERWASLYPDNYDWDKLPYYFYANLYKDYEGNSGTHGTNVAGIIASNKDNKGNMGVAFSNTTINAIRWDFMSSIYEPLKKMLDDKVLAVNMSLGSVASDAYNASLINEKISQIDPQEVKIYQEIISSYDKSVNADGEDVYDGMILVKAAGNDSYSQPDLDSGFKLLKGTFTDENGIGHSYNELQSVVVVAVNVKLENNVVQDYKISSFSNQCGVTANYCISAPGGDINYDTYMVDQLYSAGQVKDGKSQYVGMAGTSQATPVVTGSIAFLKNAYPYMKSSEILDLIFTTANKNASDYSEYIYGHGLLDLGAAVTTYVPGNNGKISTYNGNDVYSSKLDLNTTNLNVPTSFKNALLNVLPKKITIFDKYNRPFAMSTQNYVTETHGDYKGFKNDVYNISRKSKVSKVSEGNFNFSFAGTSSDVMSGGMGFISAEYKQGRNVAGFYFSENTSYNVDDYFSSELNNPFMSFNSAYGIHNTFNFANGMGLKFEAVTGENGLYDGEATFNDNSFTKQSYGFNTELQIVKNGKFGLSLSSGLLYEDSALLGMNGNGAFDVADSSTYNTGITAYWYPTNKLTLSGSYYQGFTNAQSFNSSLLSTTDLVSDSFAFNANYKMDKKTNFGMLISSPLRVRNGSLKVNFPSGRDAYSDVVYRDVYKASLKPEAREYRVSAYLNKDFSDKLSLRSEMAVRFNPEHQKTGNDYRAMFGLNWTFN